MIIVLLAIVVASIIAFKIGSRVYFYKQAFISGLIVSGLLIIVFINAPQQVMIIIVIGAIITLFFSLIGCVYSHKKKSIQDAYNKRKSNVSYKFETSKPHILKASRRLFSIGKDTMNKHKKKTCPYCKEKIHNEATKCKHCHSKLTG